VAAELALAPGPVLGRMRFFGLRLQNRTANIRLE